MWKITQRFVKHCSCHFHHDYVTAGHCWQPYVGEAVGGDLDSLVLIGGAEASVVLKIAPMIATTVFAETDNFQLSTRLILHSRVVH
jgi:hypothetical protein